MTVAEPDKLPYEMPMQSLIHSFSPEFIKGRHTVDVLRECEALQKQVVVERAILRRSIPDDQPAQQRRISILEEMVREGLSFAQAIRDNSQPETASLGGYHIGDRVLVTETGGIHGKIEAFVPAFQPTHFVVLMDNSKRTTVPPGRVAPPRED